MGGALSWVRPVESSRRGRCGAGHTVGQRIAEPDRAARASWAGCDQIETGTNRSLDQIDWDQIEIERRSVPTATVLFYLNIPGAVQIPAGGAGKGRGE